MRFRFVDEHRSSFPANRLCEVVGVSSRGLRAFRSRPASRRQRSDLITLAPIKEQSRLSLGSYGRPRMTEELKRDRSGCWPSSCWSSDAPERHISGQTPQTQGDNG